MTTISFYEAVDLRMSTGLFARCIPPSPEEIREYKQAAAAEVRERVQAVKNGKADPNAPLPEGETLLHYAAEYGTVANVRALITAGADINVRSDNGYTPLIDAGKPAIVRALIDAGADPKTYNQALSNAAYNGRRAIVRILLDAGADPDAGALIAAIVVKLPPSPASHTPSFHFCAVARALLDAGVDPNATDEEGNTPLHVAIESRLCVPISILLDGGADPNARNNDGNTLLHMAAGAGGPDRSDTIIALLDGGADPNARNNDGNTPLHLAADISSYSNFLGVLLDAGANPGVRNNDGKTPSWLYLHHEYNNKGNTLLHEVARYGTPANIRALLDAGEKINAQNKRGDTPLHLAVWVGTPANIRALLDAGADRSKANKKGETPVDWAIFSDAAPANSRALLEHG